MKKRIAAILLMFVVTVGMISGGKAKQEKITKTEESTSVSEVKKEATETTITDQMGRSVTVPTAAKRIVVLQHHTLDILLELQAEEQIIGVMSNWEPLLDSYVAKVFPDIKNIDTPGDLKQMNVEEVTALDPDVVFVSNQMPEETIKQLEDLGIPTVVITLYVADKEQASTIHPELVNPDEAYTDGLKQAIEIISTVAGKKEKGQELWDYVVKNRKIVTDHLKEVPEEKRIKVYMANEDMYTYGTGKYVGTAMKNAGAKNVAETVNGYKQVTVEQVVEWNPEVIFVQSRYAKVLDEIKTNPQWSQIDAVKNDKLIYAPDYTKLWGNPTPESMALGEIWLAKSLYPEEFKDVDLDALVEDFYTKFYGISYKDTLSEPEK